MSQLKKICLVICVIALAGLLANSFFVNRTFSSNSEKNENLKDSTYRIIVGNLETLRKTDAVAGSSISTLGYYEQNDGGAADYIIKAKLSMDNDDGGATIILNNGNVAKLLTDGFVNIRKFGAKGDGIADDTKAVVNAAEYCSKNNKILFSDNGEYKTTENCVVSMVKQVELHGHFTTLELRYNHKQINTNLQLIEEADHLIIRDYKTSTFHIGKTDLLEIIADYDYKKGSSCAYNMFYGGYWNTCSLIGGKTGGWINENSFYRTRINTLNIGVNGYYHHNNNRFYDVNLEKGIINLDRASNNYILCRGEGGVEVNTTDHARNNIVETSYISSRGNGVNSYTKSASIDSNIRTTNFLKNIKQQNIMHLDINNLPWNDKHNFIKKIAHIDAWSKLGSVILSLDTDMYLFGRFSNNRAKLELLDENFSHITDTTEKMVKSRSLSYDNSNALWKNNTDVSGVFQAVVFASPNSKAKYVKVELSNGRTATDVDSIELYCGTVGLVKWINAIPQKPTAKVVPTLETRVPKGFEVLNTGADKRIWKWVFNGSSWVTVNFP